MKAFKLLMWLASPLILLVMFALLFVYLLFASVGSVFVYAPAFMLGAGHALFSDDSFTSGTMAYLPYIKKGFLYILDCKLEIWKTK
jgi:hypothetical protein